MLTFEVNFEKLRMAARFWLLGMANHDPRYFNVIDALEYCLLKHNGQRNGGDPEAIHQLRIFHGLRTMHNHITAPHIKYCGVFLHDVVEDKNVPITEIETLFGAEVADVVNILSKEELGVKRDSQVYLPNVFDNEHTSVLKLGDRNDNISTMVGVFKPARLLRYYEETVTEFLPRIKEARRKFPRQEQVYENYKLQIQNQLKLIQHIINLETGSVEQAQQ